MSMSPLQLPGNALCPKPKQSPLPTPLSRAKAAQHHQPIAPRPLEPKVPVPEGPCSRRGPRLTPLWGNTCSRPPLDPQTPALSTWEAPWPFRHPSLAGLGGQLPGSTCHQDPPRYPSARPCTSMAASPPSNQSRGSAPSEISEFPLHCKPCPSCPLTPKPKNSPSTSHWRQWGAQGEGNPEHSHLLPPRLPPKSQGKLCNPSALPDTQEHQQDSSVHCGNLVLVKTLHQDACWGPTPGKRLPALQAQRAPPSHCRYPGSAQTALAMLRLTGKEGAEGPHGDVRGGSHQFRPTATGGRPLSPCISIGIDIHMH